MSKIVRVESITQFHNYMGAPKPLHPLISVIDLSKASMDEEFSDMKMLTSMYSITLKTKFIESPVQYGRKYFDFEEGVLLGIAPEQVYSFHGKINKGDMQGWALYFHPDLIKGYPLQDTIRNFGFFDYETNEALHLSEKEEETLTVIAEKIQDECALNVDDFSHDLLVSNLEPLLNYIRRFHSRQFKTRKSENSDLLSTFEKMLRDYVHSDKVEEAGLPTVSYFAEKLNLSPSYFSDLLKRETGKSAKDHLHTELIKKAKNLLLNSDLTISEVAYRCGFENPPYFSRLFKNKTGSTPVEFRKVS